MTTDRVPLGWRNSSPQAALAYLPPRLLSDLSSEFPGTGDPMLDRRLVVFRSPFNVRIRCVERPGKPPAYELVPEAGGLSPNAFKGLMTPILPVAQRGGALPACQISMNIILISDADCIVQLMPAWFWPGFRRWPGSIVSGRFPIRSWPRPLNCVLEWTNREREWVIRRGDPMACALINYTDPDAVPDLFEARMTKGLKRHLSRIDDVGSYGRNVGPMFAEAERRRPARLLERKIS